MRRALCLCALVACGCPPPRSISVPAELPDAVQIAAARARDAWCAAPVNWCPELVEVAADGWIEVGAHDAPAHNDGRGRIEIAPWAARLSADELTGPLVHEFGHYGIDGHVRGSALMQPRFATGLDIPWEVDAAAVSAWCDQQGGCA